MSPIDDELRSMFTSRAEVLAPRADRLAGIERRAQRMRRNRIAASVAGAALAVSAVAVAVPALLPDRDQGRGIVPAQSAAPTPEASQQPTAEPSIAASPAPRVPTTAPATTGPTGPASQEATAPAETSSAPTLAARYAFDPAHPWPYRGAVEEGTGDITSADRKQFATDHAETEGETDTPLYAVHLSSTTDVAVALHIRSSGTWVSFTAHDGNGTHQVTYQPTRGEDILSAYIPLDSSYGLLVGVASDQAGNLVLQTGSRAEVGGSRTAGIWDWAPQADPQARLAAFAKGDGEPYSSQPAT